MVNATKKWIFLKASSIILIPLMLWFIINLVSIYEKDYVDIVSFFSTQPSKFLTSFLMIVAFFYSSLSILSLLSLFSSSISTSAILPVISCVVFASLLTILAVLYS